MDFDEWYDKYKPIKNHLARGENRDYFETYVPREKLVELRDLCKSILDNPDATGDADLEPTEGFFFGSYEKDEWYYQDLKNTVEGITNALSLPEHKYEFYYQASW